tara:strand:+ start:2957 stop:3451 length:495 start_codon:yes stop_codon:yes gene_type:complete
MEENNTSALAENYWLTTAKVIKPGFFTDYFTNPKKRFTTGFASNVGEHFWEKYAEAYTAIKLSGGLIYRIKVVTDDSIAVQQLYQTKSDRLKFIKNIDTDKFYDTINFDIEESEKELNEEDKDNFIKNTAYKKNVLIQHLRSDHLLPNITIGDPLKNEPVVKIT